MFSVKEVGGFFGAISLTSWSAVDSFLRCPCLAVLRSAVEARASVFAAC